MRLSAGGTAVTVQLNIGVPFTYEYYSRPVGLPAPGSVAVYNRELLQVKPVLRCVEVLGLLALSLLRRGDRPGDVPLDVLRFLSYVKDLHLLIVVLYPGGC